MASGARADEDVGKIARSAALRVVIASMARREWPRQLRCRSAFGYGE
jgi:hypothetical protein